MFTVINKMFIARQLNRGLRLGRSLAGRGMQVTCRRQGLRWALDLDEGIDLSIYLLGSYEPKTLRAYRRILRSGAVVADIGANIGAHTLHFAHLVGATGRVHAFEPTGYACRKLRANLALNPALVPRVSVAQKFLVADAAARMPASIPSSWPVAGPEPDDLHAGHLGRFESLAEATATTADDYFLKENLSRLDLVKLDVDGYEYAVLRGFQATLRRFRPPILIELAPYVYDGANAAEFDELVRLLADMGYRFSNANSGISISSNPADLRRKITPGGGINALLLPTA